MKRLDYMVIDRLKDAPILEIAGGKAAQQLSRHQERYEVIILSKKEIYSKRFSFLRKALYITGRVIAVLQRRDMEKVLLGPKKKDGPYDPWFMFLGEELSGGKNSEANFARITFLDEKEEKAAISSAYQCPFKSIDAARFDYEYYKKENRDIADKLKGSPSIESLVQYVAGGVHSKQTPSLDQELFEAEVFPMEERVLYSRVSLIGLNNFTLSGGLRGRHKVIFIEEPKVLPLNAGDIIISLFGGHIWKKEIGSLGKAAIYEGRENNIYVNQTMAIIRPDTKKVNPYYLLMSLGTDYFRGQLLSLMKPGNRQQAMVSLGDFKECKIRLLPPEEMQDIGERHRKRIEAERKMGIEYSKDMAKIRL